MGIADPVVLRFNLKRKMYYLTRGRETFYDNDRIWRLWEEPAMAIKWCRESLGCEPKIDKAITRA